MLVERGTLNRNASSPRASLFRNSRIPNFRLARDANHDGPHRKAKPIGANAIIVRTPKGQGTPPLVRSLLRLSRYDGRRICSDMELYLEDYLREHDALARLLIRLVPAFTNQTYSPRVASYLEQGTVHSTTTGTR